jgi:hypothetical protein
VSESGTFEGEMRDRAGTAIRANGIIDERVAGHETRLDRFPLRPLGNRRSLVADLPEFNPWR